MLWIFSNPGFGLSSFHIIQGAESSENSSSICPPPALVTYFVFISTPEGGRLGTVHQVWPPLHISTLCHCFRIFSFVSGMHTSLRTDFFPLSKLIGLICLEQNSIGLFRISRLQVDTNMTAEHSYCFSFLKTKKTKQNNNLKIDEGNQKWSFISFSPFIYIWLKLIPTLH